MSYSIKLRNASTRRRWLAAGSSLAAGALVAASAIALPAGPARASTVVGMNAQVDVNTGHCLASTSAPSVTTVGCGSQSNEQWVQWSNQNGWTGLQNNQTGQCLDSNYSNPAYPSLGAVYTTSCNADDTFQEWTYYSPPGYPGVTWDDVQTGLCLDSDESGSVYTDGCNWNNYFQLWAAQ